MDCARRRLEFFRRELLQPCHDGICASRQVRLELVPVDPQHISNVVERGRAGPRAVIAHRAHLNRASLAILGGEGDSIDEAMPGSPKRLAGYAYESLVEVAGRVCWRHCPE